MTKLKLYLRNLANNVLPLLNLCIFLSFILGCSSSTKPTYLNTTIADSIQDICKEEYGLDVKSRLVEETLWIYLPVEDLVVKNEKPEKYIEKFNVDQLKGEPDSNFFRFEYLIKDAPEEEKYQEYGYNKKILEEINNVWKVLRRIIFSMERFENEPKFCSLVIADIKNGFEMKEIFYCLDIKKVSYQYISWTEYQHRAIYTTDVSGEIIGDKDGLHIDYKNVTLRDFISAQIEHRIRIKFQKEVEKNIDVDKEIVKVIAYTIKIYDFRDFTGVELNNLVTKNKIILNQGAVLARPLD